MHEIKHSAYAMLATVPSGEAIALTKPCRCSYKLNRAENLTGIVANVFGLGEGGFVGCSNLAECFCPLLPNPCYRFVAVN
jgi:hypothetical protein